MKKIEYPLDEAELQAFVEGQDNGQLRDLQSRKLLDWLSDDDKRARLFWLVNTRYDGELTFYSRDSSPRQCLCAGIDLPLKPAVPGFVPVTLVTRRDKIKEILRNVRRQYSSRVYAELGGGNFMLALDPGAVEDTHKLQREAFSASFPMEPHLLNELAFASVEAAAVNGLQLPVFDLAAFAEQAGLRCVQVLMGYAARDYIELEPALRASYKALVYQVQGRHFATDPMLVPLAQGQMGALLARTCTLMDAYASHDEDALEGCMDHALPASITPVLKKLATLDSPLNGEQRAVLALGAAIGTVGNVQAAVCIAVKHLFKDPALLAMARRLADSEDYRKPTQKYDGWFNLIAPALRANPPIPFLPRLKVDPDDGGRKTGEVLLALGGGTAEYQGHYDDPLVWGMPLDAPHNCAGQALAWPLIVEAVRQVMGLPDLAQGLDPLTGKVKGLEKTRGFACDRYLMSYRIDKRRAQTSLNVAMPIKAPISENAVMLRNVISAGAPRIERLLRESRHVHFAWFEVIERDSVLVLHTVYDGPFGAYLQHFALEAGDLFDVLCQFIEDPPPLPVRKYPNEFAAHLLRYNRQPAAGYFFSAYPRSEAAEIVRWESKR